MIKLGVAGNQGLVKGESERCDPCIVFSNWSSLCPDGPLHARRMPGDFFGQQLHAVSCLYIGAKFGERVVTGGQFTKDHDWQASGLVLILSQDRLGGGAPALSLKLDEERAIVDHDRGERRFSLS